MDFEFIVENTVHRVRLEKKEGRFFFSDRDGSMEMDFRMVSPHVLNLLINGRSLQVYLARDNEDTHVFVDGRRVVVRKPSEEAKSFRPGEDAAHKGLPVVTAPMPGKVIKVNVVEKEEVRKNQTLAIVEAMKMENEIKSPIAGFVKKIHVSPGDLVGSDTPLIELEPGT